MSKLHIVTLTLLVTLVVLFFLAINASARERLPEMAAIAERAIQRNQIFLSENRHIVEEWNKRKENNVLQVGILLGNGYDYDFAQNLAVPLKGE